MHITIKDPLGMTKIIHWRDSLHMFELPTIRHEFKTAKSASGKFKREFPHSDVSKCIGCVIIVNSNECVCQCKIFCVCVYDECLPCEL